MSARPWAATAGGVTLTVRLTPKGGRDAIDGIEAAAEGKSVLRVRVRTAPTAACRQFNHRTHVTGEAPEIDGSAIALVEALERICPNG